MAYADVYRGQDRGNVQKGHVTMADIRDTGVYMVVHYGELDDQSLPLFAKEDLSFTANMGMAFRTTFRDTAEEFAAKVRDSRKGSLLSGKIRVARMKCELLDQNEWRK